MLYIDSILPLGHLYLNSLSEMKRVRFSSRLRVRGPHWTAEAEDSDEDEDPRTPAPSTAFPVAFELDRHCSAGHVLLLYTSPHESGVYFLDISGVCHFVAASLPAYHRLLLLHLGLPHWQMAFTPAGMPQESEQWMRFLSPQRLAIDLAAVARGKAEPAVPAVVSAPAAVISSRIASRARSGLTSDRNRTARSLLDLTKVEASAQNILALTTAKSGAIK